MAASACPNGPSDAAASARSLKGLDWFNFFLADVQTGVGPFVAVYLASVHWSQSSIGAVLMVGGLTGVLSQLFAGALVDASAHKRALLGASVVATSVSALLLARRPAYGNVVSAQVLLGLAGSVSAPAIAAVSLGLVGYRVLGDCLGRNQRFNASGNLAAAAVMGAVGYFISARSIFWVTGLLAVPTLFALRAIRGDEIDPALARGGSAAGAPAAKVTALLKERRLLTFIACGVLFHFANAAMLPLLGSMLGRSREHESSVFLAACIMVTQVVVAVASPWLGRGAERFGRKPMLLIGFGALPIRGVLYTLTHNTGLLLAIQVLDGVGAAVFGTLSALVIADVTRGSGRFNLAQGTVGIAVGIGASASNAGAGIVVDRLGYSAGFLALSAVALLALLTLVFAMPETRKEKEHEYERDTPCSRPVGATACVDPRDDVRHVVRGAG